MSWSVDPMHTQVEFSAKHMGIMTVKGAFTGVSAAIDFNEDDFTASSVEATIDARTLSTHDDQRDAHLSHRTSWTSSNSRRSPSRAPASSVRRTTSTG